jgi:hypothetical protein
MVAGVLLGPSLFGLLAPGLQQALFPWDPSQASRDTQTYLFPASHVTTLMVSPLFERLAARSEASAPA